MNVVTAKLIIATAIFIISFVSSVAPLKVIHMSDQVFSMGNLLASGVLLSAGLVHQLPDATTNLSNNNNSDSDFPLGPFIAGLTFCAFLLFEEFMHTEFDHSFAFHSHTPNTTTKDPSIDNHNNHNGNSMAPTHSHNHSHNHDYDHRIENDNHNNNVNRNDINDKNSSAKRTDKDRTSSSSVAATTAVSFRSASVTYINPIVEHDDDEPRPPQQSQQLENDCGETTALLQQQSSNGRTPNHNESIVLGGSMISTTSTSSSNHFILHHDHGGTNTTSHHQHHSSMTRRQCGDDAAGMISIRKSNRPNTMFLESFRDQTFEFVHPIHHHDEHLANHMHGSLLASLILLCAVSIHSIFDGLSIGIGHTMSDVVSSTAAVLAHKAFAGYALGSAMVASEMKESHFMVLCLAFSICSIGGIFLGMLFEQLSDAEDSVPTGIIQAMVAGTFLYVSIVEIGLKELMMHRESTESPTKRHGMDINVRTMEYSKLFSFLVGYLLMSVLAIWV